MNIWDTLTSLNFWLMLLSSFKQLGPAAPVLLAMMESFFPFLPLVAIVTFHVQIFGTFLGFLYSWLGTVLGSFLFFLIIKTFRIKNKRIKQIKFTSLMLIILISIPFMPSVVLNIIAATTNISKKKFLIVLGIGKSIMIGWLTFFGSNLKKAYENPIFLFLGLVLILVFYYAAKKIKCVLLEK